MGKRGKGEEGKRGAQAHVLDILAVLVNCHVVKHTTGLCFRLVLDHVGVLVEVLTRLAQ